jgi:hypothetical protein
MKDPDVRQRLVEITQGVYVEHDALNIAERVHEYDPRFKIKFCDPDKSEWNDAPYMLVEVCNDGIERKCFDIWELDERVLERLWLGDNAKHDILGRIDEANAKAKKEEQRRWQEKRDESKDIVAHYLKSMKTRYSFPRADGAIVTIDDQEGVKHKVEGGDGF